MTDVQLADLVETFPPVYTKGIQTIFSGKYEFFEEASDENEKLPPGRGNYFKHQNFYHRALRVINDLIILDEAGSGKSCSVLGFTEYVLRENRKFQLNPLEGDPYVRYLNKVIILVNGPSHKFEVTNQLVCKCSDGHYDAEA